MENRQSLLLAFRFELQRNNLDFNVWKTKPDKWVGGIYENRPAWINNPITKAEQMPFELLKITQIEHIAEFSQLAENSFKMFKALKSGGLK